jgi:hypothetical protein
MWKSVLWTTALKRSEPEFRHDRDSPANGTSTATLDLMSGS